MGLVDLLVDLLVDSPVDFLQDSRWTIFTLELPIGLCTIWTGQVGQIVNTKVVEWTLNRDI